MVKVDILQLSHFKALWKTKYQNFFNHGEGKGIQTKQFYSFQENSFSKFPQPK